MSKEPQKQKPNPQRQAEAAELEPGSPEAFGNIPEHDPDQVYKNLSLLQYNKAFIGQQQVPIKFRIEQLSSESGKMSE